MKIKKPSYRYSHVLILDDSDLDNFINEKMIESHHFSERVYVHTSAKSALEFLSNLERMGEGYEKVYPGVLFIDINMPMIDGFQFIEQLKTTGGKAGNNSKLVILTSSVNKEDREKAKAISKDIVFLNKPLTKQMLDSL
jgi:CheY-like chemotaxis protein